MREFRRDIYERRHYAMLIITPYAMFTRLYAIPRRRFIRHARFIDTVHSRLMPITPARHVFRQHEAAFCLIMRSHWQE